MNRNSSTSISIGVLIYVILMSIDKFIIRVSEHIYIPIMLTAGVIIIIDFIRNRKSK
jgi:hypothetical protein